MRNVREVSGTHRNVNYCRHSLRQVPRRHETSGFTDDLNGPLHGTLQFAIAKIFVQCHVDGEIPNGTYFPVVPLNLRLFRVLRTVIRADSDPARQVLFANLMRSRPYVRLAYGLHERLGGTWASTLLVSCYGLAVFLTIAPARNRGARVLALAIHENARRQAARIVSWIGPVKCGWVRTGTVTLVGRSGLAGLALLMSRRCLVRTFRIVRAIDSRHGFLVSCRAVGAIAWYVRAKAILGAQKPRAVLVSSDSNAEEVGFVGAARALAIPQVYSLSRVPDAALAAARFQPLNPRRRSSCARPQAKGTDQRRGHARGHRGSLCCPGPAPVPAHQSGDRHLHAQGAVMADAGRGDRRLPAALPREPDRDPLAPEHARVAASGPPPRRSLRHRHTCRQPCCQCVMASITHVAPPMYMPWSCRNRNATEVQTASRIRLRGSRWSTYRHIRLSATLYRRIFG